MSESGSCLSISVGWVVDPGLLLDGRSVLAQVRNVKASWPDGKIAYQLFNWQRPVMDAESESAVELADVAISGMPYTLAQLADRMDFGIALLSPDCSPPAHCVEFAEACLARKKKLLVISSEELEQEPLYVITSLPGGSGSDLNYHIHGEVEVYEALRRVLTIEAIVIDRRLRSTKSAQVVTRSVPNSEGWPEL